MFRGIFGDRPVKSGCRVDCTSRSCVRDVYLGHQYRDEVHGKDHIVSHNSDDSIPHVCLKIVGSRIGNHRALRRQSPCLLRVRSLVVLRLELRRGCI